MRLSKKIYHTIVDQVNTSIVVLDSMDRIVYYNSEANNLVCDKPKKERIDSLYRTILQIKADLSLGEREEVANQRVKIGDKEFSVTSISSADGAETSSHIFLIQEITELLTIYRQYSEEKLYIDVLNTVFDCTDDWYIVVDKNGIITMLSKAYKEFLGDENAVGKHVTEVVDNTRMHIVVKTGKEEIGDIQRIKGNK
ncbi:MAG: PAS domain-containing protein, partial [Candidatus Thiodiazotropha endolucinida]